MRRSKQGMSGGVSLGADGAAVYLTPAQLYCPDASARGPKRRPLTAT